MIEKTPKQTIEEKAKIVPTMIQMLPRLAPDPAAAIGRFIGLFCSLCQQVKIDPVKYMGDAVAEYAKMDAERQAATTAEQKPKIIYPADEKKIVNLSGKIVLPSLSGGNK